MKRSTILLVSIICLVACLYIALGGCAHPAAPASGETPGAPAVTPTTPKPPARPALPAATPQTKPGAKAPAAADLPSAPSRARQIALQTSCTNNVRELCLAFLMYAQDHNETLPGAKWVHDIGPYISSKGVVDAAVLVCPARPKTKVGYAFNKALIGKHLADIRDPARTIMLFEVQPKPGTANPVGTADNVPPKGIHNAIHDPGIVVGYVDGHVRGIAVDEARADLKQPIK